MGFLDRFRSAPPVVAGPLQLDIVGEASYQDALLRICGGRDERPAQHSCIATLQCEPSNPHDRNAVRVTIDGQTVGYLAREIAKQVSPVLGRKRRDVAAVIVGGWYRGPDDIGHFGVVLWVHDDLFG